MLGQAKPPQISNERTYLGSEEAKLDKCFVVGLKYSGSPFLHKEDEVPLVRSWIPTFSMVKATVLFVDIKIRRRMI